MRPRKRAEPVHVCDLLPVDGSGLGLCIQVRRDRSNHVDRRPPVARPEDDLGIEPVALRELPPRPFDGRPRVDEHAVHVGQDCPGLEEEAAEVPAAARVRAPREKRKRERRNDHDREGAAEADRVGGDTDRRRACKESEPADRRDGGDAGGGRHAGSRSGCAKQHRDDDAEAGTHRRKPGERDDRGAADERECECGCGQETPASRERDRAETSVEAVAEDPARGHCERERGVAERSRRGAGAERVGEVDGAPVGGGSLGHESEERRGAEHEERPLRPGENRSRLPIVSLGREEAPTGDERAQPNHDGDRAEVLQGIDAGCGGDRAEPGAGKAAEAEGRVERREDRAARSAARGRFPARLRRR